MAKIAKIIFNVILIIIIILLVIYALLRFTNKVDIYKVETGSMETNIHPGDYIMILKNTDYKENDVVTYEVDGHHVTHRIVKVDGEKITTKGDANNVEDEEITKDMILGKVIMIGGILNFVIDCKFIIVALLIGFYIVTYLLDDKKEKKAE